VNLVVSAGALSCLVILVSEGATYIRQGDHHVGHWPTFLVDLLSTITWLTQPLCVRLLVRSHTVDGR